MAEPNLCLYGLFGVLAVVYAWAVLWIIPHAIAAEFKKGRIERGRIEKD
jgi:hypothetical protein